MMEQKALIRLRFLNPDKYADIKFGVKLFNGDVGYSDNVYSFPYFCAFQLKEFLQKEGY